MCNCVCSVLAFLIMFVFVLVLRVCFIFTFCVCGCVCGCVGVCLCSNLLPSPLPPAPLLPSSALPRPRTIHMKPKKKSKPMFFCFFFPKLIHDWKRAVQRSLGWHVEDGQSPKRSHDHHGAGDDAASTASLSSVLGRCLGTSGRWWLSVAAAMAVAVAVTVAVTVPAVAATAAKQDGRRSALGPR